MDHLMAEKNENNKDSQKGQVTPKKYLKNKKGFWFEKPLFQAKFSYTRLPANDEYQEDGHNQLSEKE